MKVPYSLDVDYNACKHEGARSFCQLIPAALRDFAAIKFTVIYPKGAILFLEGQEARGVFVLRQGEVKLSISSREGKKLIIRIVQTGEILGLIAALAGSPYEVTAEAIYPCETAFVRRDDFLRLRDSGLLHNESLLILSSPASVFAHFVTPFAPCQFHQNQDF